MCRIEVSVAAEAGEVELLSFFSPAIFLTPALRAARQLGLHFGELADDARPRSFI